MKKHTLMSTALIAALVLFAGVCFAVTDEVDYGFYLFDDNGAAVKAFDETTGQVLPVDSRFYDAAKPLVIYFHGWQKGTSQRNYWRESFDFTDDDNNIDEITCENWKRAGWNVAIFYWNQFADEEEVKDAEAKIWSAQGPQGMRYRLSDGSYSTTYAPSQSIAEIAFGQYAALFSGNTSGNIRFVGHSLGNQLATNVAYMVSLATYYGDLPAGMMPERLELLDPFWSKNGKDYLNGDWTGERVRWYVEEMIAYDDLAVTWYKTSGILDLWVGDANTELEPIVALVHPRFWFLNSWQIAEKHTYAPNMYFWTYSAEAPVECTINWWGSRKATGDVAASASTATSRIKEMMGDTYEWDQVEGRDTPDPSDDWYERKDY